MQLVWRPLDLPEERVRGEGDQPAAEIAEALDDVVDVLPSRTRCGPGRRPGRRAGVACLRMDPLEVVVREVVGRLAGHAQPAEIRGVVAVEARRHAAVAVGASERHRRVAACVPRVAEAVAVGVVEVVGLPGVRRYHDCLPRGPERLRPDDERRKADAAVLGGEAHRVDTGRPVAPRAAESAGGLPVGAPGQRHQLPDRNAAHLVGAVRVLGLGPAVEGLEA